jgi:hypothetical protein
MIMMTNRAKRQHFKASLHQTGMGLLDVVLAIAIFAFGMLALVQLQGSLTRSGSDANTRTVAASIAEELVERLRGYRSVVADPDNGLWDYLEIQGNVLNDTVERGGIEYTRTATITHFWWDEENETFVRTASQDPSTLPDHMQQLVYPDFKLLRLDVAWGNSEDFYVRDRTSADDTNTADLGTGSITVYEIIPSAPPSLGSQLLSSLDGDTGPMVQYTPGDNPDIIRLVLNETGNRFKESTSARPTVFHDEYVETWFDVVTYSQAPLEQEGVFLRREEFVAVSCQCELQDTPSDPGNYGLTPTLWNGASYTEGLPVAKPVGLPVGNVQQSAFCGVCCRDHHDVDAWNAGQDKAEQVYNRANASGNAGDHPHYDYDNRGELVGPVAVGDTYVEACRLVRTDGFMRVTHDASQKTLIGFPEGYLELSDGAGAYSAYVIDAIEDYYTTNMQASFPQPNPPDASSSTVFPGRSDTDPTYLPTATFDLSQQMRARSIYADYLTAAAQSVIADCFTADPPSQTCSAPNAVSELEIYPFFDLQMTYLASWVEESGSGQVEVANDGIVDDNPDTPGPEYDRGLVEYVSGDGQVQVAMRSDAGNLGLTATRPIDDLNRETMDLLYVDLYLNSDPVPPVGMRWSGTLTSGIRRVAPSDLTFEAEGAICGASFTEWACVVPAGGASLNVTGYYLNNPRVYVCLSGFTGTESGDGRTTTFALGGSGGTANMVITDEPCTSPP